MYFGMEPNPALSAKMAIPPKSLRIKGRPSSVMFTDYESEDKPEKQQPRLGKGKGFAVETRSSGQKVYRPCVFLDGVKYSLPRCYTEVEARKSYVQELARLGVKAPWHELDDQWRDESERESKQAR